MKQSTKHLAYLKLRMHAFSFITLLQTCPHPLFAYDESINFVVRDFVPFFQHHLPEFLLALSPSLFNALF